VEVSGGTLQSDANGKPPVLIYSGATPSARRTQHDWWLLGSWIGFAATMLIIVAGGARLFWLRAHRPGQTEAIAILYPLSVAITAFVNAACLLATALLATFMRTGRRVVARALWPWLLGLLACGGVFALAMLIDHMNSSPR
jgi:hypothetical protein